MDRGKKEGKWDQKRKKKRRVEALKSCGQHGGGGGVTSSGGEKTDTLEERRRVALTFRTFGVHVRATRYLTNAAAGWSHISTDSSCAHRRSTSGTRNAFLLRGG